MLVLKYGITEVSLRKNVEPIMHMTAIGFGLATAIAGIPLKLFNNADLWCWIAPLPFDCDESYENGGQTSCIRGDNAFIYRWAFFYAPLWLCMLIVVVLNSSVFLHVRWGKKDAIKKQEAHDEMHGRGAAKDLLVGSPTGNRRNQTSVRLNNPRHRRATALFQSFHRPSIFSFDGFDTGESGDESGRRRTMRMAVPENWLEKIKSHGLFGNQSDDESIHIKNAHTVQNNLTDTKEIQHVLEVVEDFPSAAKQYTAAYQFGSRIIVAQCLAYTAAFFLAWTASSVNRVVQHKMGRNYFGLLLAQAIFEPLQGLFNVLVYRYGYYLRLRASESHLSKWEVFKLTWTWSFVGGHRDPLEQKSRLSASNGIGVSRRTTSAMSPSARTSSHSKVFSGSAAIDVYKSSGRGSAIGESSLAVNVCPDDVYAAAQDHARHSLMGELMLDFTENPSMINQKMVMIQSDFPQFVTSDFDSNENEPTPDSFPVPLTPSEDYPAVASRMPSFPRVTPTDDNEAAKDAPQVEDEAEILHRVPLHIPSDRSSTLVSVNSHAASDSSKQ
jgi:hypothetical protein